MPAPTQDEVLAFFTSLSNWGRWGDDDELGTLNLVTPDKRKQAAGLVREGVSVSCAWDIENTAQPDHLMGTPQRFMVATGEGVGDPDRPNPPARMAAAMEFIGLVYHGVHVTHVDGLSHIFWDGKMYNGTPAAKVTAGMGATQKAITSLRDGVTTRGVVLDVAAAAGTDWLEPGVAVGPDLLEAAESREGVTVEEGDVVLLRTGYGRRKRERGREALARVGYPGWGAASLPWLHARRVAMIGCDTAQDASPSVYPQVGIPIHAIGVTAMGLWLIDNCDLEAVTATAERLKRWEFQFVLAPLRVIGGTGSPANPLAIF